MDFINIAIIGAGRMGTLHAINFSRKVSRSRVVAVVDSNKELADKLARETGARAYSDINEVFELSTVDAVCIATPISSHKEYILKAISTKKHMFCEKPLTLTEADGIEIVEATKKSRCCFQLGYLRRFDDAFEVAKEKLAKGDIGNPVFIRSTGRDPGLPPVPGWGSDPDSCGDISFELCSHDYDSMRWLMDDEVVKVYAQAGILSSKDVATKYGGKMINDTLVSLMVFSRGAFGSVDGLLNIKYGYDARVEVVGDEGIITIGSMRNIDVTWGSKNKVLSFPASPSFLDRFHYAYIKEVQHFVDCVIEGKKPKVGAEDGLATLKIASAVNKSIKLGQSVIID